MNHGKVYRKLGRKPEHRKAMFANMSAALIKHEQITTQGGGRSHAGEGP